MTRAARRHAATADLNGWVKRWPDGAPLPAIQMVNAWLNRTAAATKPAAAKPARRKRQPATVISATEVTPAEAEASRPPRKTKRPKPADLAPAAGSQGDAG